MRRSPTAARPLAAALLPLAVLAAAVAAVPPAAVAARPLPTRAPRPATARERGEIERVLTLFFDGLSQRRYALACQQYTPAARRLLVSVARSSMHHPHVGSCTQAFAAFVQGDGAARKLAQIRAPRVGRIVVDGRLATASLVGTTSAGLQAYATFTLSRASAGWRITITAARPQAPPA